MNKFGYKEAADLNDGNLIWYGLALRDGDIDWLKNRMCMINRYPLMDVSNITISTLIVALCQEEHILCDRVKTLTIFPLRIFIHA